MSVSGLMAAGGDFCGDPDAGLCCCQQETPYCDDLDCCKTVCAVDPFCCEVQWDEICANEAVQFCEGITCPTGCGPLPCCGNPANGSCCFDDGTPCCDDVRCCVTVCSIDPFCCDINWDQICIDESCDLCQFVDCCITACGIGFPPACGPGAGDCFVADGTPGCDDCECCALVCGADPFCCDAAWDSVCAGQAGLVCVSDCFQIISESTECIGASGDFNYQVTGSNACTNSTISFDFVGSGGEPGEPMCFDLSLFDNNGDLCCNATVCSTVPDCLPSSQPCDLDGDQAIGVSDLLILLAAWSSSPRGPPDYDGDGTVAITDFLYLLSNWGSCQ